jgi:hypothetical protein
VGLESGGVLAEAKTMALRIATRLPRLAVVGIVLLLASCALAVGAAQRLTAVPKGPPAPVAPATVTVPDLTGQAFVFAKGTLEDTGFAWRVVGGVHGYAANKVRSQTPVAGTMLKDTGAPTFAVSLERTAYPEKGEPEDVSPYPGTAVQPVASAAPAPARAAKKAAAKPTPAPVAKPAEKKPAAPTKRPPAFVVANAPQEPLREIPLSQRATLLTAWIESHPETPANIRRFLYQHSWVVTGARFGWWHGADALRRLIAADRLVQQRWGLGRKSELVARAALAEIEAKSK